MIELFRHGSPELVSKMNQVINLVNNLSVFIGDRYVQANRTFHGVTISTNIDAILSRIPKTPADAATGFQFAEITEALSYDDITPIDEYTVQKIDGAGEKDGTDITIDRALGYEGYGEDGEDIRNYAPWFGVGTIVPIAQHYDETEEALKWFIHASVLFIGEPANRSIDIYESSLRTMAVWK